MNNESENRICQNCRGEFLIEPDDFGFYEKMGVPAPKICPDCRFKWRAMFRNEINLYTGRKCDLCDKSIVTMYNPKSPYKVYCLECYNSDKWDPKAYAMDYDYSRPFFEQLGEILKKVPKAAIYRTNSSGPNINSDYINMTGGVKNCYFIFNSGTSEECLYSRGVKNCAELVDTYFCTKSNQCYEVVNIHESSKVIYGKSMTGCVDCHFSMNLSNCTDCFGCVNLRNKSHHFLNKPMKPEEYRQKVKEILGSFSKMEAFKNEFERFSLNFPRRESNNIKNADSNGDYIYDSKNVKYSFEVANAENCKYIFSSKEIKDSMGTTGYGNKSELLLETTATGHSSRIIGSFAAEQGTDLQYTFSCYLGNNLLGCDSLKNSAYCILNKQYTKEEYEKLKRHIVDELKEKELYGLMMPPEIAPFTYNETIAQDNMPLSKEEAIAQGFRWEDDIQKTESKETMEPEEIPDHIKDVKDSITEEILSCIDCNRNYKITDQEFLFYRKMVLPIPRKCFYCRHKDRIRRRGPYKFWKRRCAKCDKEIITNYSPDRPEIVYCAECYNAEII